MRVLIPYPAAPDSFQDNVAYTLQKLRHEVLTAPLSLRSKSGPGSLLLERAMLRAFPRRWNRFERWVVKAAQEFKPQMVLCLTQSLREEVLRALKLAGVERCVVWWGDPAANIRDMGLLSDHWDALYIKNPMVVQKLRAVGLNAHLMHEACNPDWHLPQNKARDGSIAIVGNCYGYRQFISHRLIEQYDDVRIYGPAVPHWGLESVKASHQNKYVVKQEKSAVFDSAALCLNSTNFTEADNLNCRAFEICGAGGLQAIENKPAVAMCFEPDKEVLVYNTVEEIVELAHRAQRDTKWAQAIRDAGHRRAHSEHTYEDRLKKILAS
ncbi:MAG: glycosyltransferase [Pseudomonadota bacterium]